jgi:futalosine hydrolase
MIALLCSVRVEAERLLVQTAVTETRVLGLKTIVEGTLGNQNILLCAGGMGKVNAAHAASLLIAQYHPEALVIFGVGGAYPASGAAVGDVALAKEEIAGDEGVVTHQGFKDTEFIGIPLAATETGNVYNRFPASEKLLALARRVLANAPATNGRSGNVKSKDLTPKEGTFVTLSTCTGTRERARELEERYQGLCENMEGAAAAHVAVLHGIPWLEVRGISNIVEDRNLAKWDIPKAARVAQEAVLKVLKHWQE